MGKFSSDFHAPDHEYFVIPGTKLETSYFDHVQFGSIMTLVDTTRRFSVGSWDEISRRSRIENVTDNENILLSLNRLWGGSGIEKQTTSGSFKSSPVLKILEAMIMNSAQEPVGSDMAGFIDRRCDFDFEYDDSAELIIADLELSDDDTTEERLAKIDCMRQLSSRLFRREITKKFVRDNRLLKIQSQMDSFRVKTAEELEIFGKSRPVRRFLDETVKADMFSQIMLYERRLHARIKALENQNSPVSDTIAENMDQHSASIVGNTDGMSAGADGYDRVATRNRAQQEFRRAKLTESELNKVTDFTTSLTTKETMPEEMNPEEIETLLRLQLSPSQFSLMRGALLKRFQDSRVFNLSICLIKIGNTLFVKAESTVRNGD